MEYPINTTEQLKPFLRGLRRSAGLTQANVAALLGVTQQSYAKIEANPSATSVKRLFTILSLLGAKISLHHAARSMAKDSPEEKPLDTGQLTYPQTIVQTDDGFNASQTKESETLAQTGGTLNDQRLKDAQTIAQIIEELNDQQPVNTLTIAQVVKNLNEEQNRAKHLASGSPIRRPAKNRKVDAPSKLVPPSGKKETW